MKNNQSTSKAFKVQTNMFRKLLHWMSHLELSEGYVSEQDVGQQMPIPAWAGSGKKEIINHIINEN